MHIFSGYILCKGMYLERDVIVQLNKMISFLSGRNQLGYDKESIIDYLIGGIP